MVTDWVGEPVTDQRGSHPAGTVPVRGDPTVCGECALRPVGTRGLEAARGLCPTCYNRLGRQHRLPPRATQVNCPHGGTHEHGTPDAYQSDGCRCSPCKAARPRWATRDTRPPWVSATPVRSHLAGLHTKGMSWARIAQTAGVADHTVHQIHTGRQTRVRADTATRLLHVTTVPPAPKRQRVDSVDATLVRDHCVALHAQGVPWSRIADAAGLGSGTVSRLLAGQPRVTRDTATRLLNVTTVPPTPKRQRVDSVDATLVRDHCVALHAQGVPWSRIADAAGLAPGTIYRLLAGQPRVTRDTATRLLATRPPVTG